VTGTGYPALGPPGPEFTGRTTHTPYTSPMTRMEQTTQTDRTVNSPDSPHPTDSGVVGTYVHSYDASRPQYQSQIPSMRPAQDVADGYSATPIYDALYSEFRRSFRALPGDRSGEENLGFTAFGAGAFGAGLHTARGGLAYTPSVGSWQRDPRQRDGRRGNGRHAQPALPPGPRRGA
jgi:hypothetical protein